MLVKSAVQGEAAPAQLAYGGVSGKATGAARPFRVPILLVAQLLDVIEGLLSSRPAIAGHGLLRLAQEFAPVLKARAADEPTNAIAHYRLGTLYRKNGRMEDAKREIEIYKQLKDTKEKLRSEYKDLLVQPNEIRADERDEQ